METLWYKAHAFTAAPVKNYLFALADDDSVLVYDDVARRYTTCHRLTAAEQDEIRAAFARREAERVEQARRAAEREELAAHIMATGHLAECDYPIKLLESEDDGSWFAVDRRAVWYGWPGEHWKSAYDADIVARIHALAKKSA